MYKLRQRWLWTLIHRRIIISLLLVVQFAIIIYLVLSGSKNSMFINWGLKTISLLVALHIISKKKKALTS